MTATDPVAAGMAPVGFDQVVLLDNAAGGLAYMPGATPLTRLNYYDGKFLRADDLSLEQRGQRMLVQLSNQAGGPGVVHGFDVTRLDPTRLRVSPGLAIDAHGRVLLLPVPVEATLTQLLDALATTTGGSGPTKTLAKAIAGSAFFAPCELASASPAGVTTVSGTELYLVCIAYAEGLCGNEEVFGRLCEEACVTATDRPYRLDGILLKILPLTLHRAVPTSTTVTLTTEHVRSQVASAYFGDEWDAGGSRLSDAGLRSQVWCRGAVALTGNEVPVGVLARNGSSITFLDEWTARRERMEAPARRYWAGRMEMRPWDVFLAQVLQFQCQLADVVTGSPPAAGGGGKDPCADAKSLLGQSTRLLQALHAETPTLRGRPLPGLPDFTFIATEVAKLLSAAPVASDKVLVDGGIVELPAGGYLPVDPGATVTLEDQVRTLVGKGLDLRFCAVRRDQIAHELERAQHMDRISLLAGLDDPKDRQLVDILVPDGEVVAAPGADTGKGFAVDLGFGFTDGSVVVVPRPGDDVAKPRFADAVAADPKRLLVQGAGRLDETGDALSVRVAAIGSAPRQPLRQGLRVLTDLVNAPDAAIPRARRIRGLDAESRVDVEAVARAVDNGVILHRAGETAGERVSSGAVDGSETVAVWLAIDLEHNPFASLRIGETSVLHAELEVYAPAKPAVLLELRFDGRVTVRQRRTGRFGPEVVVHVDGFVHGEHHNLSGVGDVGTAVRGDVLLTLATAGGTTVLMATPVDDDQDWKVFLQWSGNPIQAVASGGVDRRGEDGPRPLPALAAGELPGPPDQRLLEAQITEDPAIGEKGNAHHDRAVQALTILQGAQPNDKTFLATCLAQLFPSAAAEDKTGIRSTTDWVLFRRRRRYDCTGTAAPPPPPPSQVVPWVATADDVGEAAKWVDLLRRGAGAGVPWKRLGTVEFEASTAELRSSPVVLRGDWRSQGGGPNIAFAGYGRVGAGVEPMATLRAEALVAAVAPVARLDEGAEVDSVAAPPPGQVVPGTDASAFFVTYTPRATVHGCVDVILAEEVDRNELPRFLREGDVASVARMAGMLKQLGDVGIVDGKPDSDELKFVVDTVTTVVKNHERQDPRRPVAFVWIQAAWAEAGHRDEAEHDAVAVASAAGASVAEAGIVVVNFDRGERCPVQLFVLLPRIQPG